MKNQRTQLLYNQLAKRILILDGAMGTMIQKFNPQEADFRGEIFKNHRVLLKGNNDLLSINRPDIIQNIHRQYLEAGADIIETNSFNANKFSQGDYELSSYVYDIAKSAAVIARETADEFTRLTPDKPRFVAGSVGPSGKTLSMSPDVNNAAFRDVNFDEAVDAYRDAIAGLIDGGADIILFETIFDTLNAKAAAYAAMEIFEEKGIELPIMFSGTISDASGRLLTGQTVEAFLTSVSHVPSLLSIGLNCALGAAEMKPYIAEIAKNTSVFVSAHPNAGLPDDSGNYTQTPAQMAEIIKSMATEGLLNIVGGCCGTSPEYIKEIAETIKNIPPRKKITIAPKLRLAGLDAVTTSDELPFLNIGERSNVAGSRKFLNLMKEKNYAEGLQICRHQIENGAAVIDINMDDAMLNSEEVMREFLLNLSGEADIAKTPLMIDSSNWEVLTSALKCVQGKSIINSISLKEGEEAFLSKARMARKFGAAILAMAFDENGQADTVVKRVDVCRRMYKLLTEKANVPPQDIIFDPNVFAVATGMEEHNSCAADFIEAVRQIKQEMPLCTISGGISNVSFSFRGNEKVRRALHSVFLYHAIRAGLGMAIVNPAQLDIYDDIDPQLRELAEAVILNTSSDAGEKLLALASEIKASQSADDKIVTEKPLWRSENLQKRLEHALIHGDTTFLQADLCEALSQYNKALEIIEHPLMDGMREAGRLFGEGKMFLPQVVKTARTMKNAVDFLTPYLDNNDNAVSAGKIVLATVKGDVHDIGKNIVSVILRCNNYEVIDLGVMVPPEKIIETAITEKADAVALSGLITPSLAEMAYVAELMEKRGLNIPLFVGGATTSKEHTALHIQPNYSSPCIQTRDASQIVPLLNDVLNANKKIQVIEKLNAEYAEIRELFQQKNNCKSETTEIKFCKNTISATSPKIMQVETINFASKELLDYFDWNYFFKTWNVANHNSQESEQVKKSLKADAEKLLNEELLSGHGVFGIFPISSENEKVTVYDFAKEKTLAEFQFPRRKNPCPNGLTPSLADFLAPNDYLGMFTVSCGLEVEKILQNNSDEYYSLLVKIVAETLVEAMAEKLHKIIAEKYWGFAKANKSIGIRPAPGYPTCPDHQLKEVIFSLLDVEKRLGVKLTENFMMNPAASICSFLISSEESYYF
ncbi:MAG: methionine synthase [Lentisphaeria bacterium]|nr:methionine synthase [Lentisphaeria bacterium]